MENNYLIQGFIVLDPNIIKDRDFFPKDKSKWFEQDLLDAAYILNSPTTEKKATHVISVHVENIVNTIQQLDKMTSSYALFYQATDSRWKENSTLFIKSYGLIKDSVSTLEHLGRIPSTFNFDFSQVPDDGTFRYDKYINRKDWYVQKVVADADCEPYKLVKDQKVSKIQNNKSVNNLLFLLGISVLKVLAFTFSVSYAFNDIYTTITHTQIALEQKTMFVTAILICISAYEYLSNRINKLLRKYQYDK